MFEEEQKSWMFMKLKDMGYNFFFYFDVDLKETRSIKERD